MNNIFEKNISALATKDKELATKLTNYIVTDIPQLVKEYNFYNLLYKGTHLHNPQNPLGEAKEIFTQCENSPVAIHMIYGMGLGYLFQYTSANSQGSIILIEPDLNILKIAFTLVDFSNDILKKNVYIADNLEKPFIEKAQANKKYYEMIDEFMQKNTRMEPIVQKTSEESNSPINTILLLLSNKLYEF